MQKRRDSSVIAEFDMKNDTGLFLLKKLYPGDTIKYTNKTTVTFIEFKDGSELNFFTKIIEDLTKPGSKSVINQLHYNQVPYSFNGVILYYTLDRKYINGYRYTNGVNMGTVDLTKSQPPTAQVSVNSVKVQEAMACDVSPIYQMSCQTVSYAGYTWDSGCTDSIVGFSISCSGGGISGGGGSVGGDSGGGGGSGSSSPQTPNPCTPSNASISPVAIESVSNGKKIMVVQQDPGNGGGGTGTGSGTNPPCATAQDIHNNINNPCMKDEVNAAVASGLNNYTSEIANYVFSNNTYFDLNFFESTTLPNNLDGQTDCQGIPSTQNYFVADVSLNANTLPKASKEYIAVTAIHEILHAYMTFSGKLGEFNQHTDMANNYIYTMQKDLQAMFSGMSASDAAALSWGGLGDTQAWKDMVNNNPDQANKIVSINQQYKNATGTKGQRCPN